MQFPYDFMRHRLGFARAADGARTMAADRKMLA